MPESQTVEEIWVSVTEAAKVVGYHRFHIQKLARDTWNKPEVERVVRVQRHSNGYSLWLPDLLKYFETPEGFPQPRRSPQEST
jgi:hypothetical protein